jgi:hypothetical protein
MKKTEIELGTESFVIGEDVVSRIIVNTIGFEALLTLVAKAQRGTTEDSEAQKAVERARFVEQVEYYAGEKRIAPDVTALLQMPFKLARKIRAAFNEPDVKPGKVVDDKADGITSPLLFTLGTPIATDKGNIIELEFQAKTLGDIEDVLYRTNPHDQALALIRSVAVPLGQETALMAMPDWATAAISIADGVAIAQEVLPRFLD